MPLTNLPERRGKKLKYVDNFLLHHHTVSLVCLVCSESIFSGIISDFLLTFECHILTSFLLLVATGTAVILS